MITMIVDTLAMFYYEKMVCYMPSSFADMVFAGERIEVGLKKGKFDYAASKSTSNRRFGAGEAKKKEGGTHVVTSAPIWPKSQQTPHNPTPTELVGLRRPSSQGCPLNHKGLPHKTHFPSLVMEARQLMRWKSVDLEGRSGWKTC